MEPQAALEEVVVTATRREEAVQNIAASIIAFSPDDFTEIGLGTLRDMIEYTPGVSFIDRGVIGQGSIGIRGIPQAGNTPVVGIYVDDVPMSTNTPYASGAELYYDGLLGDVERVEMVKGPQGTLYGSVAVGGVVRYITREPALEELRGSVGANLSDTENGGLNQLYNGSVSVPIVKDTLGVTLSGFSQNNEGYVDWIDPGTGEVLEDGINETERKGYAIDMLYRFSKRGDIKLKVLHDENEYDARARIELEGPTSDDPLYGDFQTSSQPGFNKVEYDNYALTINYEWDWASLTSVSSLIEYNFTSFSDISSSLPPFVVDGALGLPPDTTQRVGLDLASDSKKYIQELRLTSPQSDSLEWLAGFYYADEETSESQTLMPDPVPDQVTGFVNFPSEYTEYAVYGNITYFISSDFDISLGARISNHESELELTQDGALTDPGMTSFGKNDDTVATYSLAARYRFNENNMFYGSIASGYRPASASIPVVSPEAEDDPDVDPNDCSNTVGLINNGCELDSDEVWSYEAGIKGQSDSGLFRYDLALWYSEFEDFQTIITAFGTSGNANYDGTLKAYGIDAQAVISPLEGLDISAGISWNDNELDGDDAFLGAVSGDQHPDIPEATASLRASYAFMLGGLDATFGGGLRYVGQMDTSFSDSENNVNTTVDEYVLADLNFGLTFNNISGQLYGTNLFDEMKLQNRRDQIVGPGMFTSLGVYTQPRTVGVSIKYDF